MCYLFAVQIHLFEVPVLSAPGEVRRFASCSEQRGCKKSLLIVWLTRVHLAQEVLFPLVSMFREHCSEGRAR